MVYGLKNESGLIRLESKYTLREYADGLQNSTVDVLTQLHEGLAIPHVEPNDVPLPLDATVKANTNANLICVV